MSLHVRLLNGWMVRLSVGLSYFLKGREVTLPCSYRSTCFFSKVSLQFMELYNEEILDLFDANTSKGSSQGRP